MTDKQKVDLMREILLDYFEESGEIESREGALLEVFYVILQMEDKNDG